MTIQEIAKAIADNAKTGKWLSCQFQVEHPQAVGGSYSVGVKAFGKWVQRLECVGLVDSIPEQKTLKALQEKVIESLEGMAKQLGLPSREYYLVKHGKFGLWDLRQTRYKSQFDAGKEYSHDLIAVGFQGKAMRDLINMHKFDCDLSPLDKEDNE